jgi:hypothetical protein
MPFFQTKNTNLGKFWSVLQLMLLVYFMSIWSFGIFCGHLWLFDVFFPFSYTKKNLATVLPNAKFFFKNFAYSHAFIKRQQFGDPFAPYHEGTLNTTSLLGLFMFHYFM